MEHTVIISLKGNFYHVYEEAAIVIHNLLGYKLRENAKGQISCGFPDTALGKVTIQLDRHEISYKVYKDMKGELMVLLGEKYFEDNAGFLKYSKQSSLDEAIDFINMLCEVHERGRNGKLSLGQGITAVLDLTDEEVGRKLRILKRHFDA